MLNTLGVVPQPGEVIKLFVWLPEGNRLPHSSARAQIVLRLLRTLASQIAGKFDT